MDFEIEDGGAAARIVMRGRLDGPGAALIELPFTAALGGLARPVMLDMSGVSFVGSLGIRLLLSVARAVTRKGQQIVIFAVQPAVAEVFETVALTELIPIEASEFAALARITA